MAVTLHIICPMSIYVPFTCLSTRLHQCCSCVFQLFGCMLQGLRALGYAATLLELVFDSQGAAYGIYEIITAVSIYTCFSPQLQTCIIKIKISLKILSKDHWDTYYLLKWSCYMQANNTTWREDFYAKRETPVLIAFHRLSVDTRYTCREWSLQVGPIDSIMDMTPRYFFGQARFTGSTPEFFL